MAGNSLRTLPSQLFQKVNTIEELDLSNNNIITLPETIFNATSLAILHLKNNEVFGSVDFLTEDIQRVDLSYCKITEINNMMFKGLVNLNHLVLKGNEIKKIHPAAFHTLKNLRHIDLSFNNLDQVSSLMFLKNTDLDVIKLNDNRRLKKLPSEGFELSSGSFKTYLLDVSNCDIETLSINTFATMPELRILNLAWNNIQHLNKGVFRFLNKLIDLDLSNNMLEEVPEMLFLHSKNLNKVS